MSERQCIVAVGAHTADMEFSAGAALLKHVRQGWEAHIVHLTLGEKGSASLSATEYGAQKKREAEEAARLLGATPHFLPYLDGQLPDDEETAQRLAAVLRRLQPQVLITHWRDSIHRDHTHAYHLTRRAWFVAAIRHFEVEGLPRARPARLYYADNWEDALHFEPYVFVDVSEEMEDWERAFKCYAIGRGEGGFPYWDWYRARTRLHGIARRVQHAQAFAIEPEGRFQIKELL